MTVKKCWMIALCLCCLLCGCGSQVTETELLQQEYGRVQRAEMDAEITCHLKEENRSFTVKCQYDRDKGATTTVVEPKELAGVSASVGGEVMSVSYDGISLPAGETVDLSPANCLPWLLHAAAEGYVLECGSEMIDGTECLRTALDTTGESGGKVLCTAWFDRQTLVPCYIEFSRDDQIILTVRMLSFTWEAA